MFFNKTEEEPVLETYIETEKRGSFLTADIFGQYACRDGAIFVKIYTKTDVFGVCCRNKEKTLVGLTI